MTIVQLQVQWSSPERTVVQRDGGFFTDLHLSSSHSSPVRADIASHWTKVRHGAVKIGKKSPVSLEQNVFWRALAQLDVPKNPGPGWPRARPPGEKKYWVPAHVYEKKGPGLIWPVGTFYVLPPDHHIERFHTHIYSWRVHAPRPFFFSFCK